MVCWFLCFPTILLQNNLYALTDTCLILFLIYLAVSMLNVRKQSAVIIIILLFIGSLLTGGFPSWQELQMSSEFVLIFACLLPTLSLMRAAAMTMPSVLETQKRLETLDARNSAAGIQLTSHLIGGVINIGVFSLVAASIPENSDTRTRQIAAVSAMRGMNSSILWSPFFISFAVASIYLPNGFAAGSIIIGLIFAVMFLVISQWVLGPKINVSSLNKSFNPLRPIFFSLFFICILIILTSVLLNLNALNAVCLAMPFLCLIQVLMKSGNAKEIWKNFNTLQKNSGNEAVIISISMLIATQVSQTDQLDFLISSYFGGEPQIYVILISLPITVWLAAVAGIHPVISSAPLLAYFAPTLSVYDSVFVAQAHMLGWSTGTMISFSSLSTILVSQQFRLSNVRLSFGENLPLAGGLAACGGVMLCFMHALLKHFL